MIEGKTNTYQNDVKWLHSECIVSGWGAEPLKWTCEVSLLCKEREGDMGMLVCQWWWSGVLV